MVDCCAAVDKERWRAPPIQGDAAATVLAVAPLLPPLAPPLPLPLPLPRLLLASLRLAPAFTPVAAAAPVLDLADATAAMQAALAAIRPPLVPPWQVIWWCSRDGWEHGHEDGRLQVRVRTPLS